VPPSHVVESQILVPGADAVAIPESFTLPVGFVGSLEEMLSVALLLPMDFGTNVPMMVQDPPAGIVVQSSVSLKSEAFEPVMSISLITRSDVPVFLIVTFLDNEIVPACTVLKLADVGDIEILGGGAVPESFTFTLGFLGSLEATLIVAVFLPKGTSVGLKVAIMVQNPPAGNVVQSSVSSNSEALEPVMLIALITRSAVPVFLIVIVFPEVPPSLTLPKLTEAGLREILGVFISNGPADAKAEYMRRRMLENKTKSFNFIRLPPFFCAAGCQGLPRNQPVN
jgi:hypothetical protein